MKKKQLLYSFIALAFIAATVLVGATAFGPSSFLSIASTKSYTLTLDKDNATLTNEKYNEEVEDLLVYTKDNNPIVFNYVACSAPTVSDSIFSMRRDGTIFNETPITGITSIKVDCASTSSLFLYYGDFAGSNDNSLLISSGQTYELSTSYFTLRTVGTATNIKSITIDYLCYTPDDPSSEEPEDPITPATLSYVTIEGTLDKMAYTVGEEWDLTGLTIQGYYDDDTNKNLGDLLTLYENNELLYEVIPATPAVGVEEIHVIIYYSDVLIGAEKIISGITVSSGEEIEPIETVYTLAKSVSDLDIGDKIIIVNNEKSYAMSTTQNNNNRGVAQVTIENNQICDLDPSVQVIELVSGSATASYGLKVDDGYLYAASSTKNYLRTVSTLSANASWTISFTNGEANIVAQGIYSRNTIRYNESSAIFSCYASGQLPVHIYVENTTGGTPDIPDEELTNYYSPNEYSYSSSMPSTYDEYDTVQVYNCDYAPSVGDVNVLVVPMAFSDSTLHKKTEGAQILEDLDTVFNDETGATGWESVKSYFDKCSYGALNLNFTIAPTWYQYNQTIATMGNASTTETVQAVNSAVKWYKENYSTNNCKEFDSDSNGYIDAVFIVYSEPVDSALYENFWAYCYWTQQYSPSTYSPVANTFLWASYDFMYSSGNGSSLLDIDPHTFIHEYGHAMGLDDYYDYAGNEIALGGFDMQDYNVGDHNSFSKMSLGWTKPYVVDGASRITIKSASKYANQAILIPAGGMDGWNGSVFDEYILLEFYTPEGLHYFDTYNQTYYGYPTGPKTPGIRAYHVDARLYEFIYSDGDLYYGDGFADSVSTGGYYTYLLANSNTSDGSRTYGKNCSNYRLLHLLSQSGSDVMTNRRLLSSSDLFLEGDTFSMADYAHYFYNDGLLNDGSELGFSFTVESITSEEATIRIDVL